MRPHFDTDMWWHLRTGELILDERSIPSHDPYSWRAEGRRWVAHEWLSEVAFAATFRVAGAEGLLILTGAAIGSAFLILRRTLRRVTSNGWLVAVGLLVAVYLSQIHWTIRPHVFSLVMLAFFVDTLVAYRRDGARRRAWWLVPLTLVWANLHAVFVVGVGLVWLFALIGWLERRQGAVGLVAVAGLATVAGAITPAGPAIYLYPLHVAQVSREIQEWQPPGFRDPLAIIFTLIALATPAVYAVRRVRPDPALLAAAMALFVAGFGAIKNLPQAGLVGAVALAAGLNGCQALPAPSDLEHKERLLIAILGVMGLAVAAATVVVAMVGKSDGRLLNEHRFPETAVERLQALPHGRVVHPYGWGGYLIWKARDIPVFIDGRNDMYGQELLDDYFLFEDLKPGWRSYLEANDVRYVLWQRTRPLAEAMELLPGWRLVYQDRRAVLYERSASG